MSETKTYSHEIKDGSIWRDDLNTTKTGQAVIRKVIAGTAVQISSTGEDAGTGDVTINIVPTGAASTIVSNNLSASRALVSDANGKVAASATLTVTNLDFIAGLDQSLKTSDNVVFASVRGVHKSGDGSSGATANITAQDINDSQYYILHFKDGLMVQKELV